MQKQTNLFVLMLFALCTFTNFEKAKAALSGTYTINPGGSASSTVYLSLTSAISDLISGTRADGGTVNGPGVSAAVIFELASGYTSGGETFPLTLNSVTGASGTNTITIRPASGVGSALSITSSNTTATLNLDGGNYFIIDGRPGGTGSNKYITLDNTSTSAPTVKYINDASNNTIKYCTLSGVNATVPTGAVVLFSTTSGSTGNDNNTIDYCDIRDGATNPLNAMYSAGTSSKSNSGNTVSNCNIYNFFNASVASNGINLNSNNDSWTITGNSFYQTSALTATAGSVHRVIYLAAGDGHVVTNNYIGGGAAQCGSTAWTISGAFASRMTCIEIIGGSSTPHSVQGNTIANFSWSTSASTATTSGIFCGIFVNGANTAANIGTTSGNTIGSGTGTGSISVTSSVSNGLTVGIVSSATGTVSISNNTIGSITTNGSSSSVGAQVYGIFIPSAASSGVTYTINNNTIGSTATANSINASNANSTGSQVVYGINVSANGSGAGSSFIISNNTVANLNNSTTGTSVTAGIRESGIHSSTITGNTVRNITTTSSTTNVSSNSSLIGISSVPSGSGTATISNNTIHSISNNYTGSNGTFVLGLYTSFSTSGGTNLIDRNLIHSLNNAKSSGGAVIGIQPLGNLTMTNNIVRLGIDASGSSITGNDIRGIDVFGSTTQNYYHNSFYIGGSGVANNGSAVLYVNFSGTMNIRDNIFVNARSNGSGTGKHYINLFYSLPTLTMDYNLYSVTGTGGYQGVVNTTDYTTLGNWQSGTSKDAASISGDPLFVNATGNSSAVDMHLSEGTPAEAAGTATITTDYDGDVRSAYSPTDIGADAGDFTGISWSGATNTDWSTNTNWTGNAVPLSTENAIIPTGLTNYPDISTGTISCRSVTVKSGGTLTISGGTLQLSGNISNSGTFNGTGGTLVLNGSVLQDVKASTLSITNLTLNNSAGASISSGMVNVLGTYTPTSGTLAAGGFLTLKSTVSGTARIAAGSGAGGYITGNVNIERYVPGKRAFRFMAHPFTSSLAMSALTDDIDITGSGGSPFTSSPSNNPSSYYFDVTTGSNTTGVNPGWIAFTASSTWAQYQAMRVLVRGAKGEGLTGAAYTPSATTIDLSGVPNQGDVTINLTKGGSTDFILVGNPFPSQVNMDAVSKTNVGSSFYIWDATQGAKGGYTSYSFGSSSFNLPSCAAFVTTLSASGSMVFEEADKASGTPGTMFKTTAPANTVQLRLEDSTMFWDRLLLRFDDNAMATVDYPDAVKFYNPDMSFYTWSKDDSMLSIDARPYVDNEIIPLGLYSTLKKNFKIVASDFDVPLGTKLFLHDKYLNKTEEITAAGYEYWFAVNSDTASWGNNRFELNTKGQPVNGIASVKASKLKVKLVPNPATENVTVYTEGLSGETSITLTNMMGIKVAVQTTSKGSATISMQSLANGVYIVTVQNGNQTITQKLIKQ